MIRFIDLFAGIGGLRLGFESAASALGIETECVMSSEINAKSRATYESNFNERSLGDIHAIDSSKEFDFLLAGFPCQPFSYAGKQKGFGDTRGTLFFEIERFLNQNKPEGFLLENVRGLTTHDGGKTFATILQALESQGYGVTYLVLNSSTLGVPQNRVRVYILGLLNRKPKLTLDSNLGSADSHAFRRFQDQQMLFDVCNTRKVVGDILESEVDPKHYCSTGFTDALREYTKGDFRRLDGVRLIDYRGGRSIHSWELGLRGKCTELEIEFMNALISNRRSSRFGKHQDGKRLSKEQIRTFFNEDDLDDVLKSLECKGYIKAVNNAYNPVAGNMSFEVFKFLDPRSISITLVSSDAHKIGVVDGIGPRRITPREAARIQGFPDHFKLHPEDLTAYFQLGNSVAVPVVEQVVTDLFINNNVFSNLVDKRFDEAG